MSLEEVPSDVLHHLLSEIDLRTVAKMSRVSKYFQRILATNTFWRIYYTTTWKLIPIGSGTEDFDWKRACVQRFRMWNSGSTPEVAVSVVRWGTSRLLKVLANKKRICGIFEHFLNVLDAETLMEINRHKFSNFSLSSENAENVHLIDEVDKLLFLKTGNAYLWSYTTAEAPVRITIVPCVAVTHWNQYAICFDSNRINITNCGEETVGHLTMNRPSSGPNSWQEFAMSHQYVVTGFAGFAGSITIWSIIEDKAMQGSPWHVRTKLVPCREFSCSGDLTGIRLTKTHLIVMTRSKLAIIPIDLLMEKESPASWIEWSPLLTLRTDVFWNDDHSLVIFSKQQRKFFVYEISTFKLKHEVSLLSRRNDQVLSTTESSAVFLNQTCIKIYDIETSKIFRWLSGHTSTVTHAELLETKIISSSLDHSICIWDFDVQNFSRKGFEEDLSRIFDEYVLDEKQDPFLAGAEVLKIGWKSWKDLEIFAEIIFRKMSTENSQRIVKVLTRTQALPKFYFSDRIDATEIESKGKNEFSLKTVIQNRILDEFSKKDGNSKATISFLLALLFHNCFGVEVMENVLMGVLSHPEDMAPSDAECKRRMQIIEGIFRGQMQNLEMALGPRFIMKLVARLDLFAQSQTSTYKNLRSLLGHPIPSDEPQAPEKKRSTGFFGLFQKDKDKAK
eukprot:TRINITY_DN9285_c0_g1_i1.p1 TRINITY_DN9285_c0_g1~~TRINITY_DN9285_c0_g1_i1.p1  ORF type:complete len:674 (-),score=143.09 TRINITY_DN9285_c0_g1_i1:8-2029(-)